VPVPVPNCGVHAAVLLQVPPGTGSHHGLGKAADRLPGGALHQAPQIAVQLANKGRALGGMGAPAEPGAAQHAKQRGRPQTSDSTDQSHSQPQPGEGVPEPTALACWPSGKCQARASASTFSSSRQRWSRRSG
jgi:hypothetical protein